MTPPSAVPRLPLGPLTRAGTRVSVPWGWAAAGVLVGTLLATLVWAPARWLALGVAQATEGRVQLQGARGTVWEGSARLVLTGGAGSQDASVLPSRLSWRLRPQGAGLGLTLAADCCTPTPLALTLTLQPGALTVALADGPPTHWPAALLTGLGTPWNTLALEGHLSAQTRGLRLHWAAERLQIEGTAALGLADLSSRVAMLRPLGSYQLQLQGGTSPTVRLSTVEGALQLEGQGQWVGARLRFNGHAEAAPGREAALANLLNIIGRRAGPRALITLG